jgi:putative restriction endonuclease
MGEVLGRTPSAVAMKLVNFASFDPAHRERNVKGLANAGKGDRAIWDEFHSDWEGLTFESEQAWERLMGTVRTEETEREEDDRPAVTEGERTVRVRLVQRFFREAVLSSYGYSCCICELNLAEMLNASHIIPWSKDEKKRADPRNGLSLCALHDRAFDRGLITMDEKYRVVVAGRVKTENVSELHEVGLLKIEGRRIVLPERFRPDAEALEYHREKVFAG